MQYATKRLLSMMALGGGIGALFGYISGKVIDYFRSDRVIETIEKDDVRLEAIRGSNDKIVVPRKYDNPDINDVRKQMDQKAYNKIVEGAGYSAPETVDTDKLDTGLYNPVTHSAAMEALEDSQEEDDGEAEYEPVGISRRDLERDQQHSGDREAEDPYDGLTEEEARAVRRSQIRDYSEVEEETSEDDSDEEDSSPEVVPLTDEDTGRWVRISWDKYSNDIPFFEKHVASYFVNEDILGGFDEEIENHTDINDELYRRIWTLVHGEEELDDTVIFFMDAENSEAMEICLISDCNFMEAYSEAKLNDK